MSFRSALTALAGLNVSGVTHNYDVDVVPDSIGRGQLPVLLVLPVGTPESKLSQERGAGFQSVAFADGSNTVTYSTTHLLLIAAAAGSKGLSAHLPALIDYIDSYFAALGADVRLGDTLLEPAQVQVEPGFFPYGGVTYVGCAFRHTWLIGV